MKYAVLITAMTLGLMAGPALAMNTADSEGLTLETLNDEQRDALIAILSGLPRQ